TRPENLDDLTVQVAIVRPGPIVGGAVNPYIKHRQRLREDPSFEVPYPHPSLEPVLRETLGTIIFQDQVLEVAQAFAGFSAGEAEGLRRAMSRRRSDAAIRAYQERFISGALATHPDVGRATAEGVWSMVAGFSGFGFPKAHGAAFGLLAYQSTWLRVHYAPEFLCALLDEQPMGFYPPDGLVHEAQRRGLDVLPPDVNASAVGCTVTDAGAIRLGLGYVLGVRRDEIEALVAERDRTGPFRSIEDLAARAGAGRESLEQLAWSGACDALVSAPAVSAPAAAGVLPAPTSASAPPARALAPPAPVTPTSAPPARALAPPPLAARADRRLALVEPPPSAPASARRPAPRRAALWQLGVAAPGVHAGEQGTQLALALPLPAAPDLRALSDWERLVADYATTGVAIEHHPMELLRASLERGGVASSRDLEALPHGRRVRVGGLVMARQRPATANGVTFLLLEDELGTINLIVPPPVYARHRLAVRAEPLVLAEGKLERFASAGGAINILVDALRALESPDRPLAPVAELPGAASGRVPDQASEPTPLDVIQERKARPGRARREEQELVAAAAGAGDFRAVAPPVMSFTQGRRR
ncbi:MAG TPA: hypothetical protein VGJ32_11870, partial [Solirubrobacteraceae bacterium]